VGRLWDLAFAKRPGDELYDLRKDPGQLENVADEPEYAQVKAQLSERLLSELRRTGDPRVVGGAERLETYPYYGGSPTKPGLSALPARMAPAGAAQRRTGTRATRQSPS